MIEVNHKPTKTDPNSYEIVGDSLSELVSESLKRIRPQSQNFYKKELESDLENANKSLIDRHAGMGQAYTVILKIPCAKCGFQDSGFGKYGELCYKCDKEIRITLNQ